MDRRKALLLAAVCSCIAWVSAATPPLCPAAHGADGQTTSAQKAATVAPTNAQNAGEDWQFTMEKQALAPFLDPEHAPATVSDQDRKLIEELTRGIVPALPDKLSAAPTHVRKLLVITRGSFGDLHAPGQAGLLIMLREAAKKYGAFELTEWYRDVRLIDAEMLKQYDAVVINSVGQSAGPEGDGFYNVLLPDYVRAGGGVFLDHASALLYNRTYKGADGGLLKEGARAGDPGFAPYSDMLGATVTWPNVHPKHQCNVFPVKVADPENPLMAAFMAPAGPARLHLFWPNPGKLTAANWVVQLQAPQELQDELYVFTADSDRDQTDRVLLRIDTAAIAADIARDPGMKDKYPEFPADASDFSNALIWVKHYGQGRVYYGQFGHFMAMFTLPCIVRAYLDGLLYVTGDLKCDDSPARGGNGGSLSSKPTPSADPGRTG